jgi:hypothetical protein
MLYNEEDKINIAFNVRYIEYLLVAISKIIQSTDYHFGME